LHQITYEEFLEFSANLFKKVYSEGFLYGNLTQEEANTLWTTLDSQLKGDVFPEEERTKRQILILPEGQGPYMIVQTTPMLGNAALLLIEQGDYSFEKRAAQQVLGKALKQAFFDTLRTKQQTAYIAKAWEKEEERQLLQFLAVQSSTHQPNELISRFELFLENFIKQFSKKFPKERFENMRKMLITTLQSPPENLKLMGERLFTLAFDYDGDFQLINKRIASLQALTYEEMQKAADEFISRENTRRIAILIEGATPKENDFRYEIVTKEDLHHQGSFVAWK